MESPKSWRGNPVPPPPVDWPVLLIDDRQRVVAAFGLSVAARQALRQKAGRELADALNAQGIEMAAIGELLSWIEERVDAYLELSSGSYRGILLGSLRGGAGGAYVALCRQRGEATPELRKVIREFAQNVWQGSADLRLSVCATLAVDDSDVNRGLIARALRRLGCRADMAASAGEALAMRSKRAYDLVLADLSMPGINGLDLARILRRLPGGSSRETLIVGLCGTGDGEERDRCYAAGMDGFVEMPPSADALRPYLRAALERRGGASESSAEGVLLSGGSAWRGAEILDVRAWEEEADLHRRLVRRFIGDGAKAIRKMRDAAQAREIHPLELTLHAFKGSSDAIRAMRLAGACVETLARLRDGRLGDVESLVDTIALEFDSLKATAKALGYFDRGTSE